MANSSSPTQSDSGYETTEERPFEECTIEVAYIHAHEEASDTQLAPFVHTGSVGGVPVDMLFDTGAPASLIDLTVYYRIPAEERPHLQAAPDQAGSLGRPSKLKYTGLGGTSTFAQGCGVFDLVLAGNAVRHWMWVVDMAGLSRGLILGLDFQVALDVRMEPAHKRATLNGKRIPLHRRTTDKENHPVRVLEAFSLPAGSSKNVLVELQGDEVSTKLNYMVKPLQDMLSDVGLLMAHCVVHPEKGDAWGGKRRVARVAVLNVAEETCWIEKDQLLGTACEVLNVDPLHGSGIKKPDDRNNSESSDDYEKRMRRDFPALKPFISKGESRDVEMAYIQGYVDTTPAWPRGTAFPEYEDAMPSTDWEGEPLCGGKDLEQKKFCPAEEIFPHVPEHLRELIDGCKLETFGQRKALADLLAKYQDVFASPGGLLGHTDLVKHTIDVAGKLPIKQRARRVPLGKKKVCDDEIDRLESAGIIEPSNSPWSSPVVLVTKKDGSVRFCVDYRKLNEATVKDAYPIPKIEECIDTLSGAKWFCTLDLLSGYHQVEMAEEDKEKTAFSTHRGHHQFTRMSFGLTNAPATFERLMDLVLKGLNWEQCLVYLDDVVVFGKTFEETLENLRLVLERFRAANLRVKPPKCSLFQKEVLYLGHIISEEGVACDPAKIEAVSKWPVPRTVKDVRSFIGFAGYYRKFVNDFSTKAAPLHELTKIDVKWIWDEACQAGFEAIKLALTTAPVLGYPRDEGLFILDTDASLYGVGAVLAQVQDGEERVISYVSKKLSKSQVNYCTTKRELLAVVLFTKHFSHYLLGREKFLLRTDHSSIRWLCNFKGDEGMLARWISQLQQYNFEIQHRAGKDHGNADGMSRRPIHLCPREDCPDCGHYRVVEIGVIEVSRTRKARRRRAERAEAHEKSQAENGTGPMTRSRAAVKKPGFVSVDLGTETQGGPLSDSENSEPGSTGPEFSSASYIDSDSEGVTDTPGDEVLTVAEQAGVEKPTETWAPSNWLETLTPELLRVAQERDDAIGVFLKLVEDEKSRPAYKSLEGPSLRWKQSLWMQWGNLTVRKGVLYRMKRKSVVGTVYQLVTPLKMTKKIFTDLHALPQSGHNGMTKTLERISKRYYWPSMKRNIRAWIRQCSICEQGKPGGRRFKLPMQTPEAGRPLKKICLDIVNMHKLTERGNRVALVVTDTFTKWTEAYALPNHKAETVAKTLVVEFILRYGVPLVIHSDQGAEFESKVFKCIYELMGIEKTRTSAYNPSGNGEVERLNRSILTMLKAYTDQKHCTDWDEYLPFVLSAYRNSVHESTKMTPNRMMMNREVDVPLDLIYGAPDDEDMLPYEYAQAVRKNMRDAHSLARESLGIAALHQKRNYDQGSRRCKFQEGQWVWFFYSPRAGNKLLRVWTGPWLVLEKCSNVNFKIQEKKTSVPRVVHGRYLKAYEGQEVLVDWRAKREPNLPIAALQTGETAAAKAPVGHTIPTDLHVNAPSNRKNDGESHEAPVRIVSFGERRALLQKSQRTDRLKLNSPLAPCNEKKPVKESDQAQGLEEDQVDEFIRLSQEDPLLGPLNPYDVGEGKLTEDRNLELSGLRRSLRDRRPPERFGQDK